MKTIIPADYDGEMLTIGDYVKYDSQIWEIMNHEDGTGKYWDEDYEEHAILLLSPRSFDGKDKWVADYEVEGTGSRQLYFDL